MGGLLKGWLKKREGWTGKGSNGKFKEDDPIDYLSPPSSPHWGEDKGEGGNVMKEDKEEELEEAKELFKEGLKKIFKATAKVSRKIVEGFREGYAEDISKKEKW